MALFDAFLKIDGIAGESTDDKHKGEIEVLSFSFGITRAASQGGGGGAGKPVVQDFHFVKRADTVTPVLFDAVCSGQGRAKAVFSMRNSQADRAQDFFKITFEDVLISSLSHGGYSGGDLPTEGVSLNFTSFKVDVRVTDPKTGAPMGWVSSQCDLPGSDVK